MKVAIIGSRNFTDYNKFKNTIVKYIPISEITQIISGGAKGADSLASKFAKENGIELIEFLADWDKYGKSAGIIRNEYIIQNSDLVIAFWDGVSKGTANGLGLAKKQKKDTVIVYF